MKADVHGSCVSFSILKKVTETGFQNKLECLDNHLFFSHINIAGTMTKRIDILPTEEELFNIPEHLRRNLVVDLKKNVIDELERSDAEYLMIDVFDFGRVQWAYGNGSFTYTYDVSTHANEWFCKIQNQIEGMFRWIDLPTFLWYPKVDEYMQRIVKKYGKDHIILNRVSFSKWYIDMNHVLREMPSELEIFGSYKDQKKIRDLEDYIVQKYGIWDIDISKYFVADQAFTGDIVAVHYEEEYYHQAGKIVEKIVTGGGISRLLDLEFLRFKLQKCHEVIGNGISYLECAEAPFCCYEPLDELMNGLDIKEIVHVSDKIIRLYEYVEDNWDIFGDADMEKIKKQNILVDKFEEMCAKI